MLPPQRIADHMAHYRAYFTALDGKLIKAKDIVQADDQAAIISARALIGMYAIELWQRDRRIVVFDAMRHTGSLASPAPAPGIAP